MIKKPCNFNNINNKKNFNLVKQIFTLEYIEIKCLKILFLASNFVYIIVNKWEILYYLIERPFFFLMQIKHHRKNWPFKKLNDIFSRMYSITLFFYDVSLYYNRHFYNEIERKILPIFWPFAMHCPKTNDEPWVRTYNYSVQIVTNSL